MQFADLVLQLKASGATGRVDAFGMEPDREATSQQDAPKKPKITLRLSKPFISSSAKSVAANPKAYNRMLQNEDMDDAMETNTNTDHNNLFVQD